MDPYPFVRKTNDLLPDIAAPEITSMAFFASDRAVQKCATPHLGCSAHDQMDYSQLDLERKICISGKGCFANTRRDAIDDNPRS